MIFYKEKFHNNKLSQVVKMIMYNHSDPDFYEISKNISEYEKRKINLGLKIKELEALNTETSKKEVRRLKNLDTFGDLPFDSLFIGVENFKQLCEMSEEQYEVQVKYYGKE